MKNSINWFEDFIKDCCTLNCDEIEKSINLYRSYLNYCFDKQLHTHSTADFYEKLKEFKFKRLLIKRIKYFKGIKLKDNKYLCSDFWKCQWQEKVN